MKPNDGKTGFQLARALSAIVDVVIFLLASGGLVFLEFSSDNVQRGFFCGDRSISFREQKDTIPIKSVIIYGLSPLILMWITEYIFIPERDDSEKTFRKRFCLSWRITLRRFKDYGVNLVLMLLVMDVCKISIGEHRPHFLDTCKPDKAVNCSKGEFINAFECTNQAATVREIRDASRSFPSGHACISIYTTLFLIWFLQSRVPKLQTIFFVPFLQSILMAWACFCCVSRITDNRHHKTDVLGGIVLGTIFAFYTCLMSKNFCDTQHSQVSNSNELPSNQKGRLLSAPCAKEEFTLNNLE